MEEWLLEQACKRWGMQSRGSGGALEGCSILHTLYLPTCSRFELAAAWLEASSIPLHHTQTHDAYDALVLL